MKTKLFKIAEFTQNPGGRSKRLNGVNSGEFIREQIELLLKQDLKVVVVLDGVKGGYPATFLEEVFGGLIRSQGSQVVKRLDILSIELPSRKEEALNYQKKALTKLSLIR